MLQCFHGNIGCIIVYILTVLSSVLEDSCVIIYIVTVLSSGQI